MDRRLVAKAPWAAPNTARLQALHGRSYAVVRVCLTAACLLHKLFLHFCCRKCLFSNLGGSHTAFLGVTHFIPGCESLSPLSFVPPLSLSPPLRRHIDRHNHFGVHFADFMCESEWATEELQFTNTCMPACRWCYTLHVFHHCVPLSCDLRHSIHKTFVIRVPDMFSSYATS
jgi:hypothetical protein